MVAFLRCWSWRGPANWHSWALRISFSWSLGRCSGSSLWWRWQRGPVPMCMSKERFPRYLGNFLTIRQTSPQSCPPLCHWWWAWWSSFPTQGRKFSEDGLYLHGRKFKWHVFAGTKDLFKSTTPPNHHLPHGHHVSNDSPPQQKNIIRTKSQMIKFCSGRLEGLVTSGTKIQMTYICRDERHI